MVSLRFHLFLFLLVLIHNLSNVFSFVQIGYLKDAIVAKLPNSEVRLFLEVHLGQVKWLNTFLVAFGPSF
jgi:hypothetical protein